MNEIYGRFTRIFFFFVLFLLIYSSTAAMGAEDLDDFRNKGTFIEGKKFAEPFNIQSDEEFSDFVEEEDVAGTGTEEDPYVIENYNILAYDVGYAFYLRNISYHLIIRDCYFRRNGGNSRIDMDGNLVLQNLSSSVIENCTFSGSRTPGINMRNCSDGFVLRGNHFFGDGVQEKNCNNTLIRHNYFNRCSLEMSNSSYLEIHHNEFVDTRIEIKSSSNRSQIFDNSFNDSGISIVRSSNSTIYENHFYHYSYQKYFHPTRNNVEIRSSHDNEIFDNKFINGSAGVYIKYTCWGNKVYSNEFRSFSSGIFLESVNNRYGKHRPNYIFSNRFESGSTAIYSDYAHKLEIYDNEIEGMKRNGISIWMGEDIHIYDNTITGSGENGINLRNSKINLIEGNTITDCKKYGVRLNNSRWNEIGENDLIGNVKGIYKTGEGKRKNTIYSNNIDNRFIFNYYPLFWISPLIVLVLVYLYFIKRKLSD